MIIYCRIQLLWEIIKRFTYRFKYLLLIKFQWDIESMCVVLDLYTKA